MSKCMTCKYALYDGMCLAQGKFTLLDAPACDDYKPRVDVEVSQLKAENAKLREENKRLRTVAVRYYTGLMHSDDVLGQIMARKRLKELGIEVKE